MLIDFFLKLKAAKVPVTTKEYLMLIEGMQKGVVGSSIDDFYYFSRTCLVKDEANFDKFDRAFGEYFKGVEAIMGVEADIPLEWLRKQVELNLSPEEKAKIEAMGGWEKLMETLKKRLEEQKGRHQGGNKWIGTGGTSPFGAYGYNPEGVRVGQDKSRNRSAVKVWDKREFANLDDTVELGTRNMKMALRKLRRFARRGAPTELALTETIDATARSGGWLDIKMVPERHNVIKVLLLLDVGGSMDDHVKTCEELFSAARSEFKHLEQFYFHNFTYENLWRDNRMRGGTMSTIEITRTYGPDYRLVLVGDATMSPYEITSVGGSIEHWNEQPGQVWLQRLLKAYPKFAWINPQREAHWPQIASIEITRELLKGRMYPLNLAGLDQAIDALR